MPTMKMTAIAPPIAPPTIAPRLEGDDGGGGLFEDPEGKGTPGLGQAGGGDVTPQESGRTTR